MKYNNQHLAAGSQGTQSLSLREAESDEAIPDNVTPIPLVRGASFHSPPVKGDERGFDFLSPLKRGDKMGVLTVTPLAPLTLRGGLKNNRQYP